MKFLIALSIVALAVGAYALTDDQKSRAEGYAKECIKSTGADPAVIKKMKTGDTSNKDEKTQCFAKCFFEKSGFMDSKGKFQEKVAKEKLGKGGDKAKTDKLVDACKGVKGANDCETGFKLYECYIQNKYHPLS